MHSGAGALAGRINLQRSLQVCHAGARAGDCRQQQPAVFQLGRQAGRLEGSAARLPAVALLQRLASQPYRLISLG